MLPSLATTLTNPKALTFPLIVQPKIDGVRGWNPKGTLLGRSMEPHANKYTTNRFSSAELAGMDGELYVGSPFSDEVCRATTSAVNTIAGQPQVVWALFDMVTRETFFKPYEDRLSHLMEFVHKRSFYAGPDKTIHVMPSRKVKTLDELLEVDEEHINLGYEGTIVRKPYDVFRSGRLPEEAASVLRMKRFTDREARIIGIIEGSTNNNMQTFGADGYAKRSTHAANMVPSGTVGALVVEDLETGEVHTVSKGKLSHRECKNYFQHQHLILGRICTYRSFPRGSLNKLRWPTFRNFRAQSDMEK